MGMPLVRAAVDEHVDRGGAENQANHKMFIFK